MRLRLKTNAHARKFVNETLAAEWLISAFPELKKAYKLVKTEEYVGDRVGHKM